MLRSETKSYALETLAGLAHLHGMGIAHGDLSMKNLLITAENRILIADYGSAYSAADYIRQSSESKCTMYVRPPEALRAKERSLRSPTWAADVWAVGLITLSLGTGVCPTLAWVPNDIPEKDGQLAILSVLAVLLGEDGFPATLPDAMLLDEFLSLCPAIWPVGADSALAKFVRLFLQWDPGNRSVARSASWPETESVVVDLRELSPEAAAVANAADIKKGEAAGGRAKPEAAADGTSEETLADSSQALRAGGGEGGGMA